jgi:hypothetical protein
MMCVVAHRIYVPEGARVGPGAIVLRHNGRPVITGYGCCEHHNGCKGPCDLARACAERDRLIATWNED